MPSKRPGRWKRWLAISFAVVVVVLLAAVWQLPWLLGTSAGRSFIASKLSSDSMRFAIDSLDLTWSGDQAIGGLRLTDAQGREVADVSAAFKGSLWAWARGSRDFGTVTLSGDVTVYESVDSGGSVGGGGSAPSPRGGGGDLSRIVIPEGIKAALEVDSLNVKYVPLPGSDQPSMAVRDVKGSFAVDGFSPVTLRLGGATAIGATSGSFSIDASLADFVDGRGAVQADQARVSAEVKGENLPVPIVERLIGEAGRVSAVLGDVISLSVNIDGGAKGGKAELTASSPRASTKLVATVDEQRKLRITEGSASLTADQRTLTSLLSVEQLAGVSLKQQATARLHIQQFTAQLPTNGESLDLSNASFDSTLSIESVSFETGRADVSAAEIRNFAVHMLSPDPTQSITLRSIADITSYVGASEQPLVAPLMADITLLRALKADGAIARETLGLSGLVRTDGVPTSLVDALTGADGWIMDTLGPRLNAIEVVAGRETAESDATRVRLSASAQGAQMSAAVELANGRVELLPDKPIDVAMSVRPELRDRLKRLVAESKPEIDLLEAGTIRIRVTSLSTSLEEWRQASATGSVVLQGIRGTYTTEGEERPAVKVYDIDSLAVDFDTAALAELITAEIRAAVRQDGVAIDLNGHAEVAQALDAAARTTSFETMETTVPLEAITAWSPERSDVLREALGGPARLTINATQFAAGLSANVKLRSERSDLKLTYALHDNRPLFDLSGSQRATPGLVAALLGPDPVAALAEPADLTLSLSTPSQAEAGAAFNAWPLKLDASAPRAVISGIQGVPGSVTTTNVKLNANWAAGLDGAGKYTLTGEVSDGKTALAKVNSDLRYTLGGDWMQSRGRIAATEINVNAIERTLGYDTGLLTAWLGGSGGLEIGSVTDSSGELTDDLLVSARFDRASARLTGRLVDDRLMVNTPGTLAAHLDRDRLGALLNKWTGAAESKAPGMQWAAIEGSDIRATIRSLSLPLAALSGEAFDPAQLAVDADFVAPRIALKQGATDFALTDTALKVSGKSLADGLRAQLTSATRAGAAQSAGMVDLNGLVTAASSDPADRRYNVSGDLKGVPVAIVDAIAQLEGRLVAAIGPAMDMKLGVADAHANGGTVSASITTPNGTLTMPRADLRDKTLVIERANPVSAALEVTPEMSSNLLSNVNPLLYDVRKKAGPIAFNASRLVLPLDGDVSKLGGEFTLDLGQLYVPTKGILGEFLGQLKPKSDSAEPDRVETLIPPITARITNGVLQYDQFVMQSQAFEISTSGKVDLVNRKLDLLASVPLIGWKSVFADMTKIAPAFLTDIPLNVPFYLVVRGPIDKPEIKPDPKGAQRVANEFFKNIGGNLIDNALDGLFKPKK